MQSIFILSSTTCVSFSRGHAYIIFAFSPTVAGWLLACWSVHLPVLHVQVNSFTVLADFPMQGCATVLPSSTAAVADLVIELPTWRSFSLLPACRFRLAQSHQAQHSQRHSQEKHSLPGESCRTVCSCSSVCCCVMSHIYMYALETSRAIDCLVFGFLPLQSGSSDDRVLQFLHQQTMVLSPFLPTFLLCLESWNTSSSLQFAISKGVEIQAYHQHTHIDHFLTCHTMYFYLWCSPLPSFSFA